MTQALATPPASPLDRLNAQMATFVEHFATTGDQRLAAVEAGCHPNRAVQFARAAMNDPTVRAGYEHVLRTRFSQAGPISLNLLIEMVEDKSKVFEPRVRLEAAKTLLDRSGYTSQGMREASAGTQDLREMTREQLLEEMNRTEAELANRAKLASVAPGANQFDTEVIDMEE